LRNTVPSGTKLALSEERKFHGQPPSQKQLDRVKYLHELEGLEVAVIAKRYGIGQSSVRRMLAKTDQAGKKKKA